MTDRISTPPNTLRSYRKMSPHYAQPTLSFESKARFSPTHQYGTVIRAGIYQQQSPNIESGKRNSPSVIPITSSPTAASKVPRFTQIFTEDSGLVLNDNLKSHSKVKSLKESIVKHHQISDIAAQMRNLASRDYNISSKSAVESPDKPFMDSQSEKENCNRGPLFPKYTSPAIKRPENSIKEHKIVAVTSETRYQPPRLKSSIKTPTPLIRNRERNRVRSTDVRKEYAREETLSFSNTHSTSFTDEDTGNHQPTYNLITEMHHVKQEIKSNRDQLSMLTSEFRKLNYQLEKRYLPPQILEEILSKVLVLTELFKSCDLVTNTSSTNPRKSYEPDERTCSSSLEDLLKSNFPNNSCTNFSTLGTEIPSGISLEMNEFTTRSSPGTRFQPSPSKQEVELCKTDFIKDIRDSIKIQGYYSSSSIANPITNYVLETKKRQEEIFKSTHKKGTEHTVPPVPLYETPEAGWRYYETSSSPSTSTNTGSSHGIYLNPPETKFHIQSYMVSDGDGKKSSIPKILVKQESNRKVPKSIASLKSIILQKDADPDSNKENCSQNSGKVFRVE